MSARVWSSGVHGPLSLRPCLFLAFLGRTSQPARVVRGRTKEGEMRAAPCACVPKEVRGPIAGSSYMRELPPRSTHLASRIRFYNLKGQDAMTSKSDRIKKQQAQRLWLYQVLTSICSILGWTVHILMSKHVKG